MLPCFRTCDNRSPVPVLSTTGRPPASWPWWRLQPLLLGLAWSGTWAAYTLLQPATARPHFLLNLTPSVPRGVYRLRPLTTLTPGLLVAFPVPPTVAHLAGQRGYLAPTIPLLKPLAALPGATVCVQDRGVMIQGHWVAPVAAADTHGRPLPRWRGCVRLGPTEVFPLSLAPHSFDARYFGPVAVSRLLGEARPVWTWGVGAVRRATGHSGQDKGTPYRAPFSLEKQTLPARHRADSPAHQRNGLVFQPLATRHDAVVGQEIAHAHTAY